MSSALFLYSDVELLETQLSILVSTESKERKVSAAFELKAHVETAVRELSLDRFAKV